MGKQTRLDRKRRKREECMRERLRRLARGTVLGAPVWMRACPGRVPSCPECSKVFDLTKPDDPMVINYGVAVGCRCGGAGPPADGCSEIADVWRRGVYAEHPVNNPSEGPPCGVCGVKARLEDAEPLEDGAAGALVVQCRGCGSLVSWVCMPVKDL